YASADASPALARESGLRHFGLLSAALMAAERASNNTGLGRLFNAGGGNASDRELDFFRIERAKIYEHIYTASQRLAADPQFDFVVLHWPVPHPPGIYDRTRNRKQWTKKSNYFDNLELVDYTIGQVRQTMVEAKVWESTTLVLTADHPLRPNLYAKHSYWTQEEETLARLRKAERVPFLVKLAGQRSGIEYQGNFDTLRTRALLTAMMQGSVSSAEQVIEWLGRQQSANLAERRQ
ncbi:MAG: sulfatase-like hydrolase/transferase, partial [Bryobacteraceae bacterium]